MKRIVTMMFVLVCLLSLVGCMEDTTVSGDPWEKFSSALAFTTDLEYYSIETEHVVGSQSERGKLILSSDNGGRPVAYKKNADGEYYWSDGVAYCNENGNKVKRAVSINSFLEISDDETVWDQSMVADVKFTSNDTITFSDVGSGNKVEAKIGGVFLERLTVTAVKSVDGKTVTEKMSYTYINPGKKPSLTLPNDLEAYHY